MTKINCICSVICLSFLSFIQAKAQSATFVLDGEIKGQKDGFVSLTYTNGKGRQVDSSRLKQGTFHFKGMISEPTMAILRGDVRSEADDDPNSVGFYLEKGHLHAIAEYNHFKEVKITGSKTQKEYEALEKQCAAIDTKSDSLYEKFSKINYDFIAAHPGSYVSAFNLTLYKSRWPVDSVRLLFTKLHPAIQNSFHGKEVTEMLKEIDDNSPGKTAKEFSAIDLNGKAVRLSQFKGRYVLLDFWASWCIPCRQSTPHMMELFKKFHNQGMDIIGVSDDHDTDAWKKAVEKDGVGIWHNILSGLKIDKSGETDNSQWISKRFGVQVLPTKILIDKNGIIIGRYTGTEEERELDKKLSELFE